MTQYVYEMGTLWKSVGSMIDNGNTISYSNIHIELSSSEIAYLKLSGKFLYKCERCEKSMH